MYGWLWRLLPFGFRGKVVTMVGLAVGAVLLLWFTVFPAVEPMLPNKDGQITDTGGTPPAGGDVVDPGPGPSRSLSSPQTPSPSRTGSR